MKLSEYCDKKEALWNEKEEEKVEKLIKYINDNINDDLFKIANTNDSIEVFNKLKVWLFKFYNKYYFCKIAGNSYKSRLIWSGYTPCSSAAASPMPC